MILYTLQYFYFIYQYSYEIFFHFLWVLLLAFNTIVSVSSFSAVLEWMYSNGLNEI